MTEPGHGASRLKPERSARSNSTAKGSGAQRKKVINGIMRIQVPKKDMDAIDFEMLKQEHRILDVTDSGIKNRRCGTEIAPAIIQATFIIVAVIGIASNYDVVNRVMPSTSQAFLSLSVSRSSSALGRVFPDGWL